MGKDYYKILNIEKSANQDEIKRAFRKLAHKYHPDKPDGDEAKFKEINEAYQVLGNAEKRSQYDQFGSTFDQQGGFGGGMNWEDFMKHARQGGGGFRNVNFDFGDLGDMFGDIFGFGGGSSKRENRGSDIQIDITIEFKEAVFGVKKQIELYKYNKCSHCHGNGAEPGTPIDTCKTCNGQGRVTKVQRTFLGAIQTASICPDCNGQGKKAQTPCSKCSGQGISKQNEMIEINIPAGIENGSTIRLSGKGNAAAHGGEEGDLYVNVFVKNDSEFERHGSDVIKHEKISFRQAALGDKIEVQTLDGAVDLKIPSGTQPNTKFRLRGKGIPILNGTGRGDLYVVAVVEVPKKLTRKQRKMLEEF